MLSSYCYDTRREAAKGVSEANDILRSVRNVSFLLKTAFLIDVLRVVNKLCKVFQKDQLDIDPVDITVKGTVNTLDAFKNENGTTLTKVYADFETDFCKDLQLIDNHNIRIGFQKSSQSYLKTLMDNMSARSDGDSVGKLLFANRIINPKFLLFTNHAIAAYGKEALKKVDVLRMKDNYLAFKMVLKNF